MRMRILWVTTAASLDGPGRMLSALLNHWSREDAIRLCALERVTPDFRDQVPAWVEAGALGMRGVCDMRAFSRLARICRSWRPDVMHTQLPRADWIGRAVARWAAGVPVLSTIQNVHSRMYDAEFAPLVARVGSILDRLTAPLVDRFIAVSQGVRADLVRTGVPAARVSVVPNALDFDRCHLLASRESVRRAWRSAPDDIVIGTVALLKAQKGIPFLVQAAKLVVARQPHARFVHMGDGPLTHEARRWVAAAGLGDRFRFLDRVAEPMTLLAGLDLFVLPSLWEGLPVALLEAMAAALPCIGTRVSGIQDVIEDGVSGVLVGPADALGLADAIVELAARPSRCRALGAAGRDRVRRDFNATGVASSYRRQYEQVLRAP
jgi:glycosyltransferase involved in cell wall biosynthesis